MIAQHSMSRVCVGGVLQVASGVTVTGYSVVHGLLCESALSADTRPY